MKTILKTSLVLVVSCLLSFSAHAKDKEKYEQEFYLQEFYLGSPYITDPLGEGEGDPYSPRPLVRYDGFDCVTYLEMLLATKRHADEKDKTSHNFMYWHNLIRYMDGEIGFFTRAHIVELHWINNAFFLGGKWARTHSERAKQLFTNDLFEIGNHAWTHGNFALLDEKAMIEQIEYTQAQYDLLMQEIAKSQNKEYIPKYLSLFRFPYGRSSEKALDILKSKNLWVIQWDVVGEPESDNTNPLAFEKVLAQARPGSIFLFHGNTIPKGTEFIVTRLVETLQNQGYEFTTVSKLLDMGKPEIVKDGYFEEPGDNIIYDDYFGTDGTGVRHPNSNN